MSGAERRARGGWVRRLLVLVMIAGAAAWIGGLIVFASSVPIAVERPDTSTDAVVVLTGGSQRLAEGLRLLNDYSARRMFISGVHEGTDTTEILDTVAGDRHDVAARIEIGHEAGDTAGNALETAEWARAAGIGSIRLVTAAYHMPRSLYEFRRAMPEVELIAHPVFPPNVRLDDWWIWPGTTILLSAEYSKLLISKALDHGSCLVAWLRGAIE